uniref:Methyltransf_21 domain-containing protein n=1 Tax=Panagrellus redivivus TaxID=6233 RepID=A0A7E4WDR8_PANRE
MRYFGNYSRLVCVLTVVLAVYSVYTLIHLLTLRSPTVPEEVVDTSINMTQFREVRPETPPTVSAEDIFDCLIEKFKDGDSFAAAITWLNLANIVKNCRQPADTSVMAETFVGDEPKFFIPGPTPSFDYTMMTLGIGHNIEAEKKILQKYKKCSKYVGVDPTKEFNEKLVTDVGGQFMELTVGAKDDVSLANILNVEGTAYHWSNVTHTSLQGVIKLANLDKVDLMLIDVEGAEFDILDSFIEPSKNQSTICQFNVEIHSPWTNGVRGADIIHTLYRLTKKREFMLFNAEAIQIKHEVFNRCFFINIKDPYCVQKYYPSFLV